VAIESNQAAGGSCALLTLTVPHGRTHRLLPLLGALQAAWAKMGNQRAWKDIRSLYGIHGTIRATEITAGAANGWHPHLHLVLFAERLLSVEDHRAISEVLFPIWRRCAIAAGLGAPSQEHGVDVRGAEDAAGYVAKWGLHAELALSSMKSGRGDRYTPWELLAQLEHTGNVHWWHLWREYAEATKGSRQLVWSHGLRARFHVVDASDQALADQGGDDDEALWRLVPRELWRYVYRAQKISSVLQLVAAGDRDGLNSLLASLIGNPKPQEE